MTLVIGVGNDLRGDDGAGLAVARGLAARAPAGVEVLALDGEPVTLMQAWADHDEVVVVDAVASEDPPGTVVRVEAGRDEEQGVVPDRRRHDSSHAVALGDAVALARVLGRLPPRLTILGITGAAFDLGTGLSAPVRVAVDDLVAALATGEVMADVPR